MKRDEILTGVRECLVATLDCSPDSVGEESRIIDDLDADSLDLLDLTFQLERRFGVSISPRDIERRAVRSLAGRPLEVDGVYTREALEELRKALPEIPAAELGEGLTVMQLPRCFRVATMVGLVARLLEEKEEKDG